MGDGWTGIGEPAGTKLPLGRCLGELTVEVLDSEKWVRIELLGSPKEPEVQAKGELACQITMGPTASKG